MSATRAGPMLVRRFLKDANLTQAGPIAVVPKTWQWLPILVRERVHTRH